MAVLLQKRESSDLIPVIVVGDVVFAVIGEVSVFMHQIIVFPERMQLSRLFVVDEKISPLVGFGLFRFLSSHQLLRLLPGLEREIRSIATLDILLVRQKTFDE